MKPDLRDIVLCAGIAVLFAGVYQIYSPAAYILLGIAIIAAVPYLRSDD